MVHALVHLASTVLVLTSSIPTRASPEAARSEMRESSELVANAEALRETGRYDLAIASLERAVDRLPTTPGYELARAEILLRIVEVQHAAYDEDQDLSRLYRAKSLLDSFLGPLDILDEQSRNRLEERRAQLSAQIAQTESDRSKRQVELLLEQNRARADHLSKRARKLRIAGVATTSIGIANLAIITTGLGLGRASSSRVQELTEGNAAEGVAGCRSGEGSEDCLSRLHRRGNAGNLMVVTGASAGGAMLLTGLTLLLLARKNRVDANSLDVTPKVEFTREGAVFALMGRF